MNRKLTNKIRYAMDEWIPPVIRNSYWFMYPVFFLLYGGRDVRRIMQFKTLVRSLPESEADKLYKEVDVVSRNRKTDLAESNVKYIINQVTNGDSVLDVGCGKGFLLNRIRQICPNSQLEGLDLENTLKYPGLSFTSGTITSLPFTNDSFDIVICTHTIEHIIPLNKAISELIRVCRRKLIIVTPCQRYFYYTLDGHVNFFYRKEELTSHLPFKNFECEKLDGDWIFTGEKS
jgi:SAM-dependent methyltransferase